ncbi:hypothetical protein CWE15_08615 [Aliidiomarina taiwanensis]|uniref:HDOD domain-containing protein n=1 Tax=Aliidiomarina taiwanensis TaxID=946228 RepID=A0A432X0Y9_9GAMM|nr:HDOD domain-containing protein [Aliidiomarina taiwanensis]RUO39812.1 hypothetical protein CWE15_08615 [Aliidiomarina taiwanensis]
MSYSYIARQAIVDREQTVYGYELLFRNSDKNVFPNIDPDEATAKVLLQQHLMGDIHTVCLGKRAFINFHTNTLLNNFPRFLNKAAVYIEVLETVEVTPELIAACKLCHDLGYKLALDDHDFENKWQQLMPYVSLVKVDIQQEPIHTLGKRIEQFKRNNIDLLAERIETQEEFDACLKLGFRFFQGYFFERPTIIKNKVLSPQKITLLQLLAKVHQPDVSFHDVAEAIKKDLSLTYSLLKFVNSAAFNKGRKITDIKHAVVFVGESEIKKYVALVSLARMADEHSDMLVAKSLTRALFLSEVERLIAGRNTDNSFFMVGFLSLLDVLLQVPMVEVLRQIPISEEIIQAVLHKKGKAGHFLRLVETYEEGNWDLLGRMTKALHIEHIDIGQCYITASDYCHHLLLSTQS